MIKVLISPEPAQLVIKHPATGEEFFEKKDGTKIKCIFKVVGTSSKEFHKAMNEMSPYAGLSPADETARITASLIIGWEDTGFFDESYTPAGALELMSNPDNTWMKAQVKKFQENTANFFMNGAND